MSIWTDFVKPVVVLGTIAAVTSALLAVTNSVTAPVIAENTARIADETRKALLPAAAGFAEVVPETETDGVTDIYEATDGTGYVVSAEAAGYGGQVPVMVAFDADGNIAAVRFLSNSETPGLGQKVRDEDFGAQFAGMPAAAIGLSDIDGIAGATISSGAAVSAVNAAITAYSAEAGVEQIDLAAMTPEEVRDYVLPEAGGFTEQSTDAGVDGVDAVWYKGERYGAVVYASVPGFYGEKKPLTAVVGFDDDGVITGVWFDASNETDGVGSQVGASQSFAGQFVGGTSAEVDAIAGATVSSTAAMDAVDRAIAGHSALLASYNAAEGE